MAFTSLIKDSLRLGKAFQSQKENYELIKNKVEQHLIAQEETLQAEVTLATEREFSRRHGNELREYQRSIQANFGVTLGYRHQYITQHPD